MAYWGRSKNINSSRLINLFVEVDTNPHAKGKMALIGTPGTLYFCTVPTNPIRGMYSYAGYMWVVGGNTLYRISYSAGTATVAVTETDMADELANIMADESGNHMIAEPSLLQGYQGSIAAVGTLKTNSGRVAFKDNGILAAGVGGNQLALVDGVAGYIYNIATSTFSIISNTLVSSTNSTTNIVTTTGGGLSGTPLMLEFMDGYFICVNNTMQLVVSNLYDGTQWNPLASAFAEATSDPIQGVVNYFQQLLFIKQYSSEIWYDSGTPTSEGCPFSRISGGVIPFGTLAPNTIRQANNSIYCLGWQLQDGVPQLMGVVQYQGGIPTVVSPPNINYHISQLGTVADAFAFVYTQGGHTFYELTFPTANWTIVGDLTYPFTPWHERSTWSQAQPWGGRHLADAYCHFNNQHYVADYRNGNIYQLSESTYTDNGDPIVSVRQSDIFYDAKEFEPFPIRRFYVDMETGFGDTTGTVTIPGLCVDGYGNIVVDQSGNDVVGPTVCQAPPPQAMLSWSNDSGYTWSNEYEASLGYLGQYGTRLIWRRLGYAINRVFRLSISAPVRRVLVGAYME